MTGEDDLATKFLVTALALAADRGWHGLALADVAAEAGASLAELYRVYPSKSAILAALIARTDAALLAVPAGDLAAEPARDRLFDVLMRRFDALAPHKSALAAILKDAPRDPLAMLSLAPHLLRSMTWMLEAAGLHAHGIRGTIRVKLLTIIYLASLRTWLGDDSQDMARTMATLDARLRRLGSLFNQ
jgi:AcrR family transcriptional regulator